MTSLQSLLPHATESAQWSEAITYKRNQLIITAGDQASDLLYIESGAVRIYVLDGDIEQIIRFGYSGEIVTALDCFLTGKLTQLYMQSLRKTTVRKLSNQVLRKAISNDVHLNKQWMQLLESMNMQQLEREIDLLTTSPADRYQRVLDRSPRLFQEVPLRHIANYLRMTPETLSRIRNS